MSLLGRAADTHSRAIAPFGTNQGVGWVRGRRQGSPERCQGDRGAAIVEMAFVGSLLVFLLFGIVAFGYLMAFRQNLTQAAAEGARAGAVAASSGAVTTDAQSAAEQSISGFHACNNGLTCTAVKGACPSA